MLRTTSLTKRFGGLTAVDSVDFELDDRLTSIIGSNRAGSTTFFDLLTCPLTTSECSIHPKRADECTDVTDSTTYATAQPCGPVFYTH